MKTSNNLSISHFLKIKFQQDPVSLSYGLSHLYTKKIPWSNFFFKTEKSIKSPTPHPPQSPLPHTHIWRGGENTIKSNPQLLDLQLKSEINIFCMSNEKFQKLILANYPKSSDWQHAEKISNASQKTSTSMTKTISTLFSSNSNIM